MNPPISSRAPFFVAVVISLFALAVETDALPAQGTAVTAPARDRKGLAFGDYDIDPPLNPGVSLFAVAQGTRSSLDQWTDVTTPALADTDYTRDKKGVAFVDYDGDGDLDICAVGEGEHGIALFRNDGGVFTEVTAGALLFPASGSSQTWGDFDNDGDPDLAFFTEEDRPYLFRNDGGGSFTNVTPPAFLTPAHGHSSGWSDVDLDGRLDLYVTNMGRIVTTGGRLFHQESNGDFINATVDSLGVRSGDGLAWGDYDNDGDQDLFLARFLNAQDLLLRNDHGTFVSVGGAAITDALNGHSCAWADIDNDLDLDLFVANANGPNRLYRNDGGTLVEATPPAMVLGIHSAGMVFGDYDNDGWIDMFLSLVDGAQSRMFHNNGGGSFSEIPAGPLVGTGIAAGGACGDYDQDGDLDLYVSSYISRPNQLFRNDLANGNHWLEVDLEGTVSNRSAIGARVSIQTDGRWQMRELTGCTGYRSQSALTAHFGLGDATVVDRILVRWPSGILQEQTLVPANQRIRIVESGTLDVTPNVESARIALGMAPNPFAGSTRVAFGLPTAGNIRLEVVDLAGRVVRLLESEAEAAGHHEVVWDARDDAGRRVREGVYFVRLTTRSGSATRRVVTLTR